MCFYLAWITNVKKIVYGATIQDSIATGYQEVNITAKELNERGGNKIELKKGLLRKECLELLKEGT